MKLIPAVTGHKILFHKNNGFSLLLFYYYGNDERFVGTFVPFERVMIVCVGVTTNVQGNDRTANKLE